MSEPRVKLTLVEAGRGLAAWLVVLYHTGLFYFGQPGYWAATPLAEAFHFGRAGVEFFFVLTGYIMFRAHRQDIGAPARTWPFLRKRIERIYPLFWLVMAATMAALVAFPGTGRAVYHDPAVIAGSVFLFGSEPMYAPVMVSWSLFHEMAFYAVCALVIAVPRLGGGLFVAWMAACAVVAGLGLKDPHVPYVLRSSNLLFAFGVGAALLLERYRVPSPRVVLCAGLAVFLGTGLASNAELLMPLAERGLFGLGAAFFVVGAVQAEEAGLLKAPRWMVTLGAASYAVYLTHVLALAVVAKLAVKAGLTGWVPEPVAFVGLSAVAVSAGLLAYWMVDQPLAGVLRKRWPRPALARQAGSA